MFCFGIYISGNCEISSSSWLLCNWYSCIEFDQWVLRCNRRCCLFYWQHKRLGYYWMQREKSIAPSMQNYLDLLRSFVIVHLRVNAGAAADIVVLLFILYYTYIIIRSRIYCIEHRYRPKFVTLNRKNSWTLCSWTSL